MSFSKKDSDDSNKSEERSETRTGDFEEFFSREQQRPDEKKTSNSESRVSVGPYRLLQKIGEGGMGTVWLAHQEAPVRRSVALKLIRSDRDGRDVIARFEAERQALAMMDHNNIAKVLDVGATNQGTPYFVMELVNGVPLTEYCDNEFLNVRARLELLVSVCHAIQHAHQKGIIHRDLKPSNILVTVVDDKPIPKVIDFGLAKALEHTAQLTDLTVVTEFGKVVGTLQYMSPEQAEMNSLNIDTRTDVYSLGVLLYELLTGSTPLDQETLNEKSFLEILETIRGQDPPRPSARLDCSTDSATMVGQRRQISPSRLQQILRGELDWIVMKALEKNRTRRYETASALSDDIVRYLKGMAILARPPSKAYRLSKFIRANRYYVSTGVVALVLLFAGTLGMSWYAWKARVANIQLDIQTKRAVDNAVKANENAAKEKAAKERAQLSEARALAANEIAVANAARSDFLLAVARWDRGRADDARTLLDTIPKRFRNFEWHIARRRFRGSELVSYGHTDYVASVDAHPDGTRLVSAGGPLDRTIRVWDTTIGSNLLTLEGHVAGITCVRYSPDGNQIASAGLDGTVRLWDAHSGRSIATFHEHHAAVTNLAFHPNSSALASVDFEGSLIVWDLQTRTRRQSGTVSPQNPSCIAFAPDGKSLVVIGRPGFAGDSIELWSTSNEIKSRGSAGSRDYSCVCFSPDGKLIVVDDEIWTAQKLNRAVTLSRNPARVTATCFSPSGVYVVTAHTDRAIRLWEVRSGELRRVFRGHASPVTSVCFSPDGSRIFSGGGTSDSPFSHNTVRIWDVRSDVGETLLFDGMPDTESNFCFNPDGTRIALASGRDLAVRVWDAISGREMAEFEKHQSTVQSVCFHHAGSWIAAGGADGTIGIWNAASGKLVSVFSRQSLHAPERGGFKKRISFSHDGSKVLANRAAGIDVWQVATGEPLERINGTTFAESEISDFVLSPDGSLIAAGGKEITIWDATTGVEHMPPFGRNELVNSVCFHPQSTLLASATKDHNIRIWNLKTGLLEKQLPGHTGGVNCIAFVGDGSRLISGSNDKTIKIWDTITGEELLSFEESGAVRNLAVASDGKRFATMCEAEEVKVWDTRKSYEPLRLSGHLDTVTSVCIAPDGRHAASASCDKTVRVWDTATGKQVNILAGESGHSQRIWSVCMSHDGSLVASGDGTKTEEATIKIWNYSGGDVRTIPTGHVGTVTNLTFTKANTTVDATIAGIVRRWDIASRKEMKPETDAPLTQGQPSIQAANDRWLVMPYQQDVILVDLKREPSRTEFTHLRSKAQLDPIWHTLQAEAAEDDHDWFAAIFHHAWSLIGRVNVDSHIALENAMNAIHESSEGAVYHWPSHIRRALAIPRPAMSESYARNVNQHLWKYCQHRDSQMLSSFEIARMKAVCHQFPRDDYELTLGVAQYRAGLYRSSIKSLEGSMRLNNSQGNFRPAQLAFLGMNHLQLGEVKIAHEFYKQASDTLKNEKFDLDERRQFAMFQSELDEMLLDRRSTDEAEYGGKSN